MEELSKPLTLKCGLTLPNRVAKAALGERMADRDGLPDDDVCRLYSGWADGGWGMMLTGNVFVDPDHLGMPSETSIPASVDTQAREALAAWCRSCTSTGTPTLVQLNHPGRQSSLRAGTRPLLAKTMAPSAVPMKLGPGVMACAARAVLFGTPREMSRKDIEKVIEQFAHSAQVVAEAGFAGVELHAAHGYLLSQFLSSRANLREDEWGGDASNRVRIVVEIIKEVRATTPSGFALGVKLNSADHQGNPNAVEEAQVQLKAIIDAGVDFLEISGGTWEDPQMFEHNAPLPSGRTKAREAFFLSFASDIRARFPDVPLMVTGGFRSRRGMAAAIREGGCDLVGLGRPAVLNPGLPRNKIFNAEIDDEDYLYTRRLGKGLLERLTGSRAAGAGAESDWYTKQIQRNAARLVAQH